VSNVLKIKITSVFTHQNNGFSVNVFGMSCLDPIETMVEIEDKIDENARQLEK